MQLQYSLRLYPSVGQRAALASVFGCALSFSRMHCGPVRLPALTVGHAFPSPRCPGPLPWSRRGPSVRGSGWYRRRCCSSGCGIWMPSTGVSSMASRAGTPGWGRSGSSPAMTTGRRSASRRTALVGHTGREAAPSQDRTGGGALVTVVAVRSVQVSTARSAGGYFASFVVETDAAPLPHAESVVGVDLTLGHFAVLSDGTKVDSPCFLRGAEKRLSRAQQNLSRKATGSANRGTVRIKVARAHARVGDVRRHLSTTRSGSRRRAPGRSARSAGSCESKQEAGRVAPAATCSAPDQRLS